MNLFQKAITILVLSALLLVAMPAQPVYAATITVTNNNDSGAGSLRQAIADAVAGDTITFAGDYTITLASRLTINKNLTIDGTGHSITISGGGAVQVMSINNGVTVSLNNLTLKDGSALLHGGGGIFNEGTLTVNNSIFSSNSATNAGGGIYNAGTLTVNNSTFSSNSATIGGGIYNAGTLTVNNSAFSSNSSTPLSGGGIYNDNGGTLTVTNSTFSGNAAIDTGGGISNGGTLTISNSTFSGNSSANAGGGILNNGGTLTVSNSTFSGNSAPIGGGIANSKTLTVNNSAFSNNSASTQGGGIINTGPLTINNSTFSGNSAPNGGGIYNGGTLLTINNSTFSSNSASIQGGGILNAFNSGIPGTLTVNNSTFSGNSSTPNWGGGIANQGTLHLKNSILANSSGGYEDCFNLGGNTIATNINNLIETNGSAGHQCGTPMLSADPQLGALADNGGDTQTFALLASSPAIDTGDNTSCESTDQRGIARPQNGLCDLGAYEVEYDPIVQSTNLVASYNGSGPSTIAVKYSEPVKNDGSAGAANNTANYLLVEEGDNGIFDTTSCGPIPGVGGVKTDDTQITINAASYDVATLTATLRVNGGTPLPAGRYMAFACGTTSIEDLNDNKLNSGLSDQTITFTVTAVASSLPSTGFRHGRVTSLPKQPAVKAYTETAMMLEIPKIGVSMPIVGVPQSDAGWDVTWLGNSAGYLAGSAFPTWAGNTVITGHVWDAYNNPGIFAELKTLKYGGQVQIQAWGQTYTYEVRESNLVTKKNVNAVLQSEKYDWLTLVTCEFYNPFSGEYLFRRAVRAVLVSVK